MIASILNTNCALTRCSSGFGTPISLNTLRLPISYPLLLIDPLLCYSFGLAQSLPNQFDVAARRLASDLRFFLEGLENVHRPCVPHSVHRSKSVATKVPDHFQNPAPPKPVTVFVSRCLPPRCATYNTRHNLCHLAP